MNKLIITVLAVVFAVLGGCASSGDMIGTSAFNTTDVPAYIPSSAGNRYDGYDGL